MRWFGRRHEERPPRGTYLPPFLDFAGNPVNGRVTIETDEGCVVVLPLTAGRVIWDETYPATWSAR